MTTRRHIDETDLGVTITDPTGSTPTQELSPENAAALRAHFESEKDQDLGRWRDILHPHLLLYPQGEREVSVICEKTGTWGQWADSEVRRDNGSDMLRSAAARFFEARDPEFQRARRAIWEALEPRLEDDIHLDLNDAQQNDRFAALVDAATRAAIAARTT